MHEIKRICINKSYNTHKHGELTKSEEKLFVGAKHCFAATTTITVGVTSPQSSPPRPLL